jgi:PAS domain S-box-containing protein
MIAKKQKRSIRRRLTGIIMLTSTIAVLLTCIGFTASGLINWRSRILADLTTTAQVVSANSSAALTLGDRAAAAEVLNALRARPSIIAAVIYTQQGKPFVRFARNAPVPIPMTPPADGFYDRRDRIEFSYPIKLDHQRLGTLYLVSDTRDRIVRLKQYAQIAAWIIFFTLLIALILAAQLQRGISEPIVELAAAAAQVSREKTFSVRVRHRSLDDGDEIGNLMKGFNSMLAELERRDVKLVLYQTQLETTVAQRTAELTAANEKLFVAKNAAENVAARNAQLARESALILNSATDGILGINLDNEATFINPAGTRILGMTLDDFRGTTIHAAIHHSHPDGNTFPEEECVNTLSMRRGDPVAIVDDTFWRHDGTSFPVEYSSTPMVDEDGNHLGAVVVFRDVTERRAIEKLKSEFVSTVSHELRTPLTSIRGALGLLSSGLLGPIPEKGQRMLEIAVTNTDRLVRLINDILDLERIESGKVELTRAPVDAQGIMEQAREGLQAIADEAGIRIVVEPASGSLWGDSDRIIQTLTNLIGNAIKFSPRDTTVTLSGTAGEADFTFCVADHGRGVPDDKLDSIFQRFSQVDASDSRDKGGSGLGLAICQSIVGAHGGRIWAEKNDPVGTRLRFTIPLAAGFTHSARSIDSPAVTSGEVLQMNGEPSVLIVEDDADLARVMSEALQRHGLQTFHTASGSEALELCAEHEPSLIVLDLGLPDLDGFAVVRSLRKSATLRHVPLLVHSALDLSSADQARLRLGATEFLTKSRCTLTDFEEHVIGLLKAVTRTKDSQHAA